MQRALLFLRCVHNRQRRRRRADERQQVVIRFRFRDVDFVQFVAVHAAAEQEVDDRGGRPEVAVDEAHDQRGHDARPASDEEGGPGT